MQRYNPPSKCFLIEYSEVVWLEVSPRGASTNGLVLVDGSVHLGKTWIVSTLSLPWALASVKVRQRPSMVYTKS